MNVLFIGRVWKTVMPKVPEGSGTEAGYILGFDSWLWKCSPVRRSSRVSKCALCSWCQGYRGSRMEWSVIGSGTAVEHRWVDVLGQIVEDLGGRWKSCFFL